MIACQVALYPLGTDDYSDAITSALASLDELQESGLNAQVGTMSTVLTGPDDLVWQGARLLFEAAARDGRRVVMTATLSNECGCDVPPPSA